jgi:hypothetical protein
VSDWLEPPEARGGIGGKLRRFVRRLSPWSHEPDMPQLDSRFDWSPVETASAEPVASIDLAPRLEAIHAAQRMGEHPPFAASGAPAAPFVDPNVQPEQAASLQEPQADAPHGSEEEPIAPDDQLPRSAAASVVDPLERTRAALEDARRQMPGLLGLEASAQMLPESEVERGVAERLAADWRELLTTLEDGRRQLSDEVASLRGLVMELTGEVTRLTDMLDRALYLLPAAAPAAHVSPGAESAEDAEAPASVPADYAPPPAVVADEAAPTDSTLTDELVADEGSQDMAEPGEGGAPAADVSAMYPDASAEEAPVATAGAGWAETQPAVEDGMEAPPLRMPPDFGWKDRPEAVTEPLSPSEPRQYEPADGAEAALSVAPARAVTEFRAGEAFQLQLAPVPGVRVVAAIEASLARDAGVALLELASYRGGEAVFQLTPAASLPVKTLLESVEQGGVHIEEYTLDGDGRSIRARLAAPNETGTA